MGKYLLRRLLHGLLSVVVVVALIMLLIYSLMDRNLIFGQDSLYSHLASNAKTIYTYEQWEQFGYLDYVTYSEYVNSLANSGEITDAVREEAVVLGRTADKDSALTKKYVESFYDYYQSRGYNIKRLDAVMISGNKVASGGGQALFAYKDIPLLSRVWDYFSGMITFDDLKYAESVEGERKLTFTLHDPLYGGDKFAPAIYANGTKYKYMLYFDSQFPYIHQNIIKIQLGQSYSVNKGIDVLRTMTISQGAYVKSMITYPTGLVENSADNLHSASYIAGSRNALITNASRFTDDYTNVETYKNGMSKIGYSFITGIISTLLAYLVGIPLGVIMARNKDKLIDKLGSLYIIFIIAVPSLAYIFLFKAIGGKLGLPTTFDLTSSSIAMYILPIISLTLPSVAGLMRWLRRFMIDQMNSDYVKFARSGGLTENEIFTKHVLKNAAIPIIHGIPGNILSALVGAIITERVYVVPGTGNLLTTAINKYDNGVIVGVSFFYAMLSIVAIILGDILMAMVDPRISYTAKSR